VLIEALLWVLAAAVLVPVVSRTVEDAKTVSVARKPVRGGKRATKTEVAVTEVHTEAQTMEGSVATATFTQQSLRGQLVLMLAVLFMVGVLVATFWMSAQLRTQMAFSAGAASFANGQYTEALEALGRAAEYDPRNADAWGLMSEAALALVSAAADELGEGEVRNRQRSASANTAPRHRLQRSSS
jgi:hypothetical protein